MNEMLLFYLALIIGVNVNVHYMSYSSIFSVIILSQHLFVQLCVSDALHGIDLPLITAGHRFMSPFPNRRLTLKQGTRLPQHCGRCGLPLWSDAAGAVTDSTHVCTYT